MSRISALVAALACLVGVQAHYYSTYGNTYGYYNTQKYRPYYGYNSYNYYPKTAAYCQPNYASRPYPTPPNTATPTITPDPYNPYRPSPINNTIPYPTPATTPDQNSINSANSFVDNTRLNMQDLRTTGLRDIDRMREEVSYNTNLARSNLDHNAYEGDNAIASHAEEVRNAKAAGKNPAQLDACLARADQALDVKTQDMTTQGQVCIDQSHARALQKLADTRSTYDTESTGRINTLNNQGTVLTNCAGLRDTTCQNNQVSQINNNQALMGQDRNNRVQDARTVEAQHQAEVEMCNDRANSRTNDIKAEGNRLVEQCIANTPMAQNL